MKIHKAKKSLGQNFLKSEPALKNIVTAGEIKNSDVILEIGPGKGALTKKLLETKAQIIAVEKDNDLLKFLEEKFSTQIQSGSLVLVHDDILKFDIRAELLKFLSGPRKKSPDHAKNLEVPPYKIIANIPYNITGAILKKFLTAENQPECMVLMVQHEVAKRIVARDGKESILSISVKAYGEPKIIMKVPARYFSPAPKVDSAVIAITNISRKLFENSPLEEYSTRQDLAEGGGRISSTPPRPGQGTPQEGNKINEERFWEIVKAGFAHKRKKLSGNLKNVSRGFPSGLGNKRAEDLTLQEWINLAKSWLR